MFLNNVRCKWPQLTNKETQKRGLEQNTDCIQLSLSPQNTTPTPEQTPTDSEPKKEHQPTKRMEAKKPSDIAILIANKTDLK